MGIGHDSKTGATEYVSRDEAIDRLHKLLAREGIVVEPAELDALFKNHWRKLSLLAHQIHDAAHALGRQAL